VRYTGRRALDHIFVSPKVVHFLHCAGNAGVFGTMLAIFKVLTTKEVRMLAGFVEQLTV
jgi:hypothetical protein